MHGLSHLVLLSWPAVAVALFVAMGPRRGCLAAMLIGLHFLPVDTVELSGFIDLSKTSVISLSCLVGVLLTDASRLVSFKPQVWDTPIALVCLLPVASTLANGLGPYAAVSKGIEMTLTFGVPYVLGRIYFADVAGRSDLIVGVVIAAAVYVPFCLYEVRMSPNLHHTLYGFHQHSFAQTVRGGGFRPVVFMNHGLMVSLWLAAVTIMLAVLSISGAIRRVFYLPATVMLLVLAATVVLCKSSGATFIMSLAALVVLEWRLWRTRYLAWAMLLCPPVYVAARVLRLWNANSMVELAGLISPERAQSLAFRLNSEQVLLDSAAPNMLLGKGPEDFNLTMTEDGEMIWMIGDSLWINMLTSSGILMVFALWANFLVPCLLAIKGAPAAQWLSRERAPVTALVIVVLMVQIDCTVNAHLMAIYLAMTGSLVGAALPAADTRALAP
jgi:hypothetical protein